MGLVAITGRADGPADHRTQQATGAGLDQTHQPQRRIARESQPVPDAADPAAVAVGIGNLQRINAIESDRAHPSKAHPRCPGLRQWPGDHLKQRLKRGRTQPATQLTQRLFRHRWHDHARTGQAGAQLRPDPGIADLWEQPKREHEIHSGPRGQCAQPLLHRAGLRQHVINELKRQIAGQLTEMTRGEHPGSDGKRSGQSRGHDRLRRQRDLWRCVGKIVTGPTDLPEVPSPHRPAAMRHATTMASNHAHTPRRSLPVRPSGGVAAHHGDHERHPH